MSLKEKTNKILLVFTMFLLGCFIWMGTDNFANAKGESKWEYYTYEASTSGPNEKTLNELGNEGWELVAIDSKLSTNDAIQSPRYVFKRPKK